MPKGFMFVMSDPIAGREDEFNDWYEAHLPAVVKVPGIAAAQRFEGVPGLGGQVPPLRYVAVYELDTEDPEEAMENLRAAKDALSSDMTPAFDLSTVQSFVYRAVGPRAEAGA